MNKPIKVGDLVQVVHACCNEFVRTPVFEVIILAPAGAYCAFCGKPLPQELHAGDSDGYGYPVSWLKRIPPLTELEAAPRREEQLA